MVRNPDHPGGEYVDKKPVLRVPEAMSAQETHLDRGVKTLVRSDGKGDPKAWYLVALRSTNEITVDASRGIRDIIKPLMGDWNAQFLPGVYQRSQHMIDDVPQDPHGGMTEPGQPTFESLLLELSRQNHKEWETMGAVRIDDEVSVIKAMLCCLHFAQQNTLKRIAKAMIKGICPKKQAKYPYRSKERAERGKTVKVPPFWPPEEVCLFKEPDHIAQEERMALVVWFLRMRPTPEQVQEWNAGTTKGGPVKTHRLYAWTAWLMEFVPLSLIDEDGSSDAAKRDRRKQVVLKLFEIAELEERFHDGSIDGETMVQPLEFELRKTIVRSTGAKRLRKESTDVSDNDTVMNDSNDELPHEPAKKAKATPATKRAYKKASPVTKPARKATKPARKTMKREAATSQQDTVFNIDSLPPPLPESNTISLDMATPGMHHGGRSGPTSLNTSFGSSMSDAGSCDMATFTPASPYHDGSMDMPMQTYGLGPQSIQCHNLYDVPNPAFDTMPNSSTFAPKDFFTFEPQQPEMNHEMSGLSIGTPMATPGHATPQTTQHHHGPPSSSARSHDDMSIGTPMATPMYEPQNGMPGPNSVPSTPGFAAPPQWISMPPPAPFTYTTQQGVSSAHSKHAGFAIDTPTEHTDRRGRTASTGMGYRHHRDQQMDDAPMPFHLRGVEKPPQSLPASVVRGFTGHASGVGDSAYPPGDPATGFAFDDVTTGDDFHGHGTSYGAF